MTRKTQKYLIQIAHNTLEYYFDTGKILEISDAESLSFELREEQGTFVTLTKNDELRGCIGHIEPIQAVYLDIIDNTLSAAFADSRFEPLTKDELNQIKIEISILSKPQKLVYSSADDLLDKLVPSKHGVIISLGKKDATYLPQVWEMFETNEEFLSSLCQKAGILAEEWRRGKLELQIYEAEVFGENTKFT